jgi:hypothetical protein
MTRAGLLFLGLLLATGCGAPCTNATCPADQVCTGGGCAPALSATYKLTLHVTVAGTEGDGSEWDSASAFSSASPPDPGASLSSLEGSSLARFSSTSDVYSVTSVQDDVRFDAPDAGFDGGLMVLRVYDEDGDLGTGDSVCEAVLGPDAVSVLHAGVWDGGTSGSCTAISVDFEAH